VAKRLSPSTSFPSVKIIRKFVGELCMPGEDLQHNNERNYLHNNERSHLYNDEHNNLHNNERNNVLSNKQLPRDLVLQALINELRELGMWLQIRLVWRPIRLDCGPCSDRAHNHNNDHNSHNHLPLNKEDQVFLVILQAVVS
jgi:hypothetical protein